MLITEYLKLDHARIRTLLGVLEAGLGRSRVSEKKRLTDTLHELVALQRVHEAVEEDVLLPALEVRDSAVEPRLLADFEAAHQEVWKRLLDVERCAKDDFPIATLERAVRQYLDCIRRHMEQEERSLFPLADLCLPRQEAEALAQAAMKREVEALGPGMAAG